MPYSLSCIENDEFSPIGAKSSSISIYLTGRIDRESKSMTENQSDGSGSVGIRSTRLKKNHQGSGESGLIRPSIFGRTAARPPIDTICCEFKMRSASAEETVPLGGRRGGSK